MKLASCQKKQEKLKKQFLALNTMEERYEKIIEMGRMLPSFPKEEKKEENRVQGCQSLLYLKTTLHEENVDILVFSNALISSGLAALLVFVYQNESPIAILKYPPLFLKEIGILEALSPGRSNGLRSLYQKLRKNVVQFIVNYSIGKEELC